MILTGISCNEEILIIKKVHMSILAVSSLLFNSFSSFIADKPIGVAAHPSPIIFAIILDAIYSFALCSFGISGNKILMIGLKALVKPSIIPALRATCINPVHKDITPNMVIHNVIASLAELMVA